MRSTSVRVPEFRKQSKRFSRKRYTVAQRIPDIRFAFPPYETALAKQVELRWRTAGEMRELFARRIELD